MLSCTGSVSSDPTSTVPQVTKYTVTFDSQGGSAVTPQTIVSNSIPNPPPIPTLTGSSFGGWFTEPTAINPFYFTNKITNHITLYAKWNLLFTLTFDSQGGSLVTSQTIASNSIAKQPPIPTLTDRGFAGWHTDPATRNRFYFTNVIVAPTTLYAKWNPLLTLTFNSQGGSLVSVQTVTSNFTANPPPTPVYQGYGFGGWYTEASTVNRFYFTNIITAPITLYAKWDAPVSITFDSQGGSPIQPLSIQSLATPTRQLMPLRLLKPPNTPLLLTLPEVLR